MELEEPERLPLVKLIVQERRRQSLSLRDVARRVQEAATAEGTGCGATRQTVHNWERGQVPRPDSLRWLANALGLPLEGVVGAAEVQVEMIKRRQLLSGAGLLAGALLLPGVASGHRAQMERAQPAVSLQPPTQIDEIDEVVAYLWRVFPEFSTADWLLGPNLLLTTITGHLALITQLLDGPTGEISSGAARTDLLLVGARYAEFASWLSQDAGDQAAARHWTDRAMEWAQEAGNNLMVSYILTRKSSQAALARHAARTIGLAQAAQQVPNLTARVRAVAMQQEALGHALASDELACHHTLDKAVELANLSQRHGGEQGPGRYCTPEYVEIQRASCWLQLGKPRRAIDLFEQQLATLPAVHRRDRGVYLSRLALAQIRDGNPAAAATTGREAIDIAQTTGSGRISRELRELRPLLLRWQHVPVVAELHHDLGRIAS